MPSDIVRLVKCNLVQVPLWDLVIATIFMILHYFQVFLSALKNSKKLLNVFLLKKRIFKKGPVRAMNEMMGI